MQLFYDDVQYLLLGEENKVENHKYNMLPISIK